MQPLLQHYLKEYERIATSPGTNVSKQHQAALQRLTDNGLPTIQNESWRYSATSSILKQSFHIPHLEETAAIDIDSLRLPQSKQPTVRIICFNGRFHWQHLNELPPGLEITSMSSIAHNAVEMSSVNHGFVDLNTLFAIETLHINVRDKVAITPIVELYYLFDRRGMAEVAPLMFCTRNHITLEANSALQCIEYLGLVEDDQELTGHITAHNALTTITLQPGAQLNWAQSFAMPANQAYIGQVDVQQHRDSTLQAECLVKGSPLIRQALSVGLQGVAAACTLQGLSKVTQTEQIDHQVVVNHNASHTKSDIHYRGIADGKGRLIFSGEVKAAVGIQKMEATQGNYSLLLSDQAEVNTKPRLTLAADDIQCTHGATIGDLDQDAIFYLQSRGLPKEMARSMLTQAFSKVVWESMSLLSNTNSELFTTF